MRLNQQEIMLYFSCDVSEFKNLTRLGKRSVKNLANYWNYLWPGIEDSKLIGDKNPKIFEKVVD